MDYYIAPGRIKNIQKSILNPVNNKIEKSYGNQAVYAWGITPKNKGKSYAKSIAVNDKVFIFPTDTDEGVLYVGIVFDKVIDEALSERIWGESNDEKYSCVVFLKDIIKLKISKRELYNKLDYEMIPGITRFKDEKIIIMNEIFNDDSYKIKATKDYNKLKIDLFNIYWNKNDYEVDIPNHQKKAKNQKKKMEKAKRGNSVDQNPEFPSKFVGLTGEKILFDVLQESIAKNKSTALIEKFQLGVIDDSKVHINWFNKDIDVTDPQAEDSSVGKGYDMELVTDERKLKFEVKSSIHNLNIFVLTRNELIEMKNSSNDYYLILVDKFESKPRIRVVKKFSELIEEDYISMSLEHKLSIDQIDKNYFI